VTANDPVIRPSQDADIPAIAGIYGHHVLHGLASFEEVPPSEQEIADRRAGIVAQGLPYVVAERDGKILGYCYAGPFRPRSAYRFTLEDSVYIDPAEVGRGIGRRLLREVLTQSIELGYRQMIAVIGGRETLPSIRLHAALGFAHVAVLEGAGFKFGRWVDLVLMQIALGPGSGTPPREVRS
jgi:L-amino acid N-acyltransferase YncA